MNNLEVIADLSIPLKFGGSQPNAFGVEPAAAAACEYGELIGDTRRGGSCNFERITFIPHCNGTHTECVGHITDERISVRDCLHDVIIPAVLISVTPEELDGDRVITRGRVDAEIGASLPADSALIVRTLPNDDRKLSATYDGENIPPYFAADAMELMVDRGVRHLLVDLPSIDRLFDEGKLANHRIFWKVAAESRNADSNTRIDSTITELIYIPTEVADGEYLLNLQIAPFEADASPSRPLLLRQN